MDRRHQLGARALPTFRSKSAFGDMSFTPRVLLHETQDFSLTTEMAVLVPTGNQPLEGKTALTPAIAFWNNFACRWVIRGGIGDLIPLQGGGTNTHISQLAIGDTLTEHDVPLLADNLLLSSRCGLGHDDQRSVPTTASQDLAGDRRALLNICPHMALC
jgi:hypothetical protein